MWKSLCVLALVLTLSTATSMDDMQAKQGRDLLNKLNSISNIGNEIMQTIVLELNSGTDEHILDRVIRMLHELRDTLTEQSQELQASYDEKDELCMSQVRDLREDISGLEERLTEDRELLPSRVEALENKENQISEKEEEKQVHEDELATLIAKNNQKTAAYQESRDQHDSLIAALEQAKRIIRQLRQQSGLAQVSSNEVMVQLKKHQETSKTIYGNHNQKLFAYLMQLTQDVGIQADQDSVDRVIEIIDALISAEEATRQIEYDAERRRTTRFNFDQTRIQAVIDQDTADLLELAADQHTLNVKARELKREIASNNETLTNKLEQLADHRLYCNDQVSDLSGRIDNMDDILEILRQVIMLMEHSSIQGVRGMVADMDPDEILAASDNSTNSTASEFLQVDQNWDDPNYDPLEH